MYKASIIIPVLNEYSQLKKFLIGLRLWKLIFLNQLQIIIIDSQSTDQSQEVFNLIEAEKLATVLQLKTTPHQTKSIGLAVQQACEKVQSELVIILPIDVELSDPQIDQLLSINISLLDWGCFTKKYSDTRYLMSSYAWAQNTFRSHFLRQAVWTNVFFFHRKYAYLIPTNGFLEDVILSDRLRKISKGLVINKPVIVNSRKYSQDGLKTRIFSNFLILILFRLGYKNTQALKDYYQRKKSFFDLLNPF